MPNPVSKVFIIMIGKSRDMKWSISKILMTSKLTKKSKYKVDIKNFNSVSMDSIIEQLMCIIELLNYLFIGSYDKIIKF